MRRHGDRELRGSLPVIALAAGLAVAVLAAVPAPAVTDAELSDRAEVDTDVAVVPTLWWAQGSDATGTFASGGTGDRNTAVRVLVPAGSAIPDGLSVSSVSLGTTSGCAVAVGRAACWGSNDMGQLGDGTTTDHPLAVSVLTEADPGGSQLPSSATVTDVSVADGFACAVAAGRVYCWGDNTSGQLGDGSFLASSVPRAVAVVGTAGSTLPAGTVTDVETGGSGQGAYACAIAAGRLYCWGSRLHGRLGNGINSATGVTVPVATVAMWSTGAVTDVSLGPETVCAVASGSAWCWGWSGYGQLGDGTGLPGVAQTVPIPVQTAPASSLPATALVTEVAVGASSACVLHDGTPYCWGTNRSGQLGADITIDTGTSSNVVRTATEVARVGTGASQLPLGTASGLAAGRGPTASSTFCVLSGAPATSSAYCWGSNASGQLGVGPGPDAVVPGAVLRQPASQLPLAASAVAVAVGSATTILLVAP